jgi:TIR domain
MAKKKSASGKPPLKTYQIFISHATADKWIAIKICESIDSIKGASTFRDDRDIHGGDDIPEAIRRQIKQSKEILVLLTPESLNRPWVTLEIGAAWGKSKQMRITIVLCHVQIDTIPAMLKNKKTITLNELDQYLKELGDRI